MFKIVENLTNNTFINQIYLGETSPYSFFLPENDFCYITQYYKEGLKRIELN